MDLIYMIVGIGVAASVFVIAAFIVGDRIIERRRRTAFDGKVPKNYFSMPEINPGLMMSQLGAKEPAGRSLDTMIMRPTWGIKLFGLFIMVMIASVMLGPGGEIFRNNLTSLFLVAGMVIYFVAFLMAYEVRYDSDGVIAPDMFFRPKYHPWSKFISIEKPDNVHYKLAFENGSVKIKKFLVGMPMFITFVTDISDMQKRA